MRPMQRQRTCARTAKFSCLTLSCVSVFMVCACTSTREQTAITTAPPQPVSTQPAPTQSGPTQPTLTAAPTPPPIASTPNAPPTTAPLQAAEVNAKLAQIFQGAVQLDATQPENAFVGDFNGDDSEDIAIVVKPSADKLADINSEVANWILEDPRQVFIPDPNKAVQKLPAPPAPIKVQPNDVLLAVIHGYKENGWRDPAAQQTYLLVHAVGNARRVPTRAEALQALKANNSRLRGDIIQEELNRQPGYLYWAGAKYAWLAPPPRAKSE